MTRDLEKYKVIAKERNAVRGFNTICLDCGYIWEREKTPPGKCPICQCTNWEEYIAISVEEG